jgi:hypothetical protein
MQTMAKNSNPSVTVITEPFILSYPKLLKAEPFMENGKPKGDPVFSFEAISALDALSAWDILNKESDEFTKGKVEVRLVALAKEKWGDDFDVVAAVKHGGLSWPFKSGNAKADEEGAKADHYRDTKVWRGKALAEINGSPNEPSLYDGSGGYLVKLMRSTEAGKSRINELFYGGAICTAELSAVAGTTGENKYVTFYVNSIVFERDGDRLGGGSRIERIRGVKGGESTVDPSAGMKNPDNLEDEIPY